MRLLSYRNDREISWGFLMSEDEGFLDARDIIGEEAPKTILDYIKALESGRFNENVIREHMKLLLEPGTLSAKKLRNRLIKLGEVQVLSPIFNPIRNIFCVGKNYVDHIVEFDKLKDVSDASMASPCYFTKATGSMNGPYDPVFSYPDVTRQLDYEGELAVIIGKKGVNIPRERAYDYIFGYTIINDITARDLQKNHLQWFKGKSLDGFCPMGPWIVTRDELPVPLELFITSYVNGEIRQNASTRQMIFDIPTLVSTLSQGLTLEAGDILATGTPAGVGAGYEPPRFLKKGDVVRVEIEKIGYIENKIV